MALSLKNVYNCTVLYRFVPFCTVLYLFSTITINLTWLLPYSCIIPTWLPPYSHLTPTWVPLDSHLTPTWLPPDSCLTPTLFQPYSTWLPPYRLYIMFIPYRHFVPFCPVLKFFLSKCLNGTKLYSFVPFRHKLYSFVPFGQKKCLNLKTGQRDKTVQFFPVWTKKMSKFKNGTTGQNCTVLSRLDKKNV